MFTGRLRRAYPPRRPPATLLRRCRMWLPAEQITATGGPVRSDTRAVEHGGLDEILWEDERAPSGWCRPTTTARSVCRLGPADELPLTLVWRGKAALHRLVPAAGHRLSPGGDVGWRVPGGGERGRRPQVGGSAADRVTTPAIGTTSSTTSTGPGRRRPGSVGSGPVS
ncbi:hypothetical protein HBB16_15005 [Pseudonocardia sp. MCCB 268]|nr:hypothetical protein [Pseudonocardia cytotoxica]